MLNSNSTNLIKCTCDAIIKLSKPPVFLLQPPPAPPFPFQLNNADNSTLQIDIKNSNELDAYLSKFTNNINASSFKTIDINIRPKPTPFIQAIPSTKAPNNLFNATNNPYMFYITISIAILILFLLLFIVVSFVFVYLTKTKLKKTNSTTSRSTTSSTTSSSNIDNNKSNFILNTSNPATVSSLTFSSPPLTPFSTSPKSNSSHSYQDSSPTDCVNFKLNHTLAHTHHIKELQLQQHRNQIQQTLKLENNLNSFKQHNDLIKSNRTKLKNLIDSSNSSSSSSNNELIFNLNSSSMSSLSPGKLANESILTNNTNSTVLTNNSRNAVVNNIAKANFQRQQTLMFNKQRQFQQIQQQDPQQHYYESIGDVSQFYFDVDEHLNKANLNQQFVSKNQNQIVLNAVNLNNQLNVNTIKNSKGNNMNHYPITCCSCTLLRMNANANHHCLSAATTTANHSLVANQASNLNLNDSAHFNNNSNNINQSNKYYLKSLVV